MGGFAIQINGKGWRAVASESDVMAGENFSLKQPPPVVLEPIEETRKRAKAQSQPYRDLFLGRLAGIAIFSEDPAVIDECAQLRQQLLDMTQYPDYLAAETFDDMEAALLARYRAIAAGASEAIRNVFRELDA